MTKVLKILSRRDTAQHLRVLPAQPIDIPIIHPIKMGTFLIYRLSKYYHQTFYVVLTPVTLIDAKCLGLRPNPRGQSQSFRLKASLASRPTSLVDTCLYCIILQCKAITVQCIYLLFFFGCGNIITNAKCHQYLQNKQLNAKECSGDNTNMFVAVIELHHNINVHWIESFGQFHTKILYILAIASYNINTSWENFDEGLRRMLCRHWGLNDAFSNTVAKNVNDVEATVDFV